MSLNLGRIAVSAVVNGVGFRLAGLSPSVGALVGSHTTWRFLVQKESGKKYTIVQLFYYNVFAIAPFLVAATPYKGQRLNFNFLTSYIIPVAALTAVSYVACLEFDTIKRLCEQLWDRLPMSNNGTEGYEPPRFKSEE